MKPHIKAENCKKPYDDKKSCWVPNPKGEFGGYLEGITENVLMVADWEAVGKVFQTNLNYSLSLYL